MAEHVLPLGRLADLLQVVVALVGENVLAQFKHGSCPSGAPRAASGGGEDRVDDRFVAGAAADVAGDGLDDLDCGSALELLSRSALAAISMPGVQ